MLREVRLRLLFAITIMSLALAGASAAASYASSPSGSVTVRILGLPSNDRPAVVLTGPRGLHRAIAGREITFRSIPTGTYRLTLNRVTILHASGAIKRGATATALQRSVTVRVVARHRSLLVGRYATIVNPGLKVLSGGVMSVVGAAGNPSRIVLKGHIRLARGAVLSLPPTLSLPRGLLSNVVAVAYGPGTTSVSLTAASIYQVAPNFEFEVPLQETHAAAAAAGCGSASGISPYRRIKNVSFSGGWSTVNVFGVHVRDGVRASVRFDVEGGIDVTAAAGISCSVSVSFYADGMAGPIPVTAGIAGNLSGSVAVGGVLHTGGSIEVNAGGHTIGFPPTLLLIPDVSFGNPRFSLTAQTIAQASAGIGLTVKAGIGVGGAGSVTLNVGADLKFSAQPGSCKWDAEFGAFSVEGELLDWHLSTPSTPSLFTEQLGGNFCAAPPTPPPPPPPPSATRHIASFAVTPDLACTLTSQEDAHDEFYTDGSSNDACGTFIAYQGALYGPANIPAGESLGSYTTWIPSAQTLTGAGTAAEPYVLTTAVVAPGTELHLTETDSWVTGDTKVNSSYNVSSEGGDTSEVTLYHAQDCYAGESDIGTGSFDPASQSAGCIHEEANGAIFQERLTPQTPGAQSVEDFYSTIWSDVASQALLPGTCACSQLQDDGAATSWKFPLEGSTPIAHSLQFSFVEGGA